MDLRTLYAIVEKTYPIVTMDQYGGKDEEYSRDLLRWHAKRRAFREGILTGYKLAKEESRATVSSKDNNTPNDKEGFIECRGRLTWDRTNNCWTMPLLSIDVLEIYPTIFDEGDKLQVYIKKVKE